MCQAQQLLPEPVLLLYQIAMAQTYVGNYPQSRH
jgi:hypothetical protein